MIAEYVDHALQFERLAALEQNPKLKTDLEKQALAYRKLATERAERLNLQLSQARAADLTPGSSH